MLGLTRRDEFKDRRLKGTAIELAIENNKGATQVTTAELLGITYPTADVLIAIVGVGAARELPLQPESPQRLADAREVEVRRLLAATAARAELRPPVERRRGERARAHAGASLVLPRARRGAARRAGEPRGRDGDLAAVQADGRVRSQRRTPVAGNSGHVPELAHAA